METKLVYRTPIYAPDSSIWYPFPCSPTGSDFDYEGMPSKAAYPEEAKSEEESQIDRNGRRFLSPLFLLHVGPWNTLLEAHQDVLGQSPVLRCMCTGSFIESETKEIWLLDDSPSTFFLLLEYLYSGTYDPEHGDLFPNVPDHEKEPRGTFKEAIDLYLLADKYALPRLQWVIVARFKANSLKGTPQSFFTQAKRLYTTLSTTRGRFQDYFNIYASLHLTPSVVAEDWFQAFFMEGGVFGVELAKVLFNMIGEPYMMAQFLLKEDKDGAVKQAPRTRIG